MAASGGGVPQELLKSFRDFTAYPTNLLCEPDEQAEDLSNYLTQLKESKQLFTPAGHSSPIPAGRPPPLLVQFLDLSVAQDLNQITGDVTSYSDLENFLTHGATASSNTAGPSTHAQGQPTSQTQLGAAVVATGPHSISGVNVTAQTPQVIPRNSAAVPSQANHGIPVAQPVATSQPQEDPKCRFIFLYAGSSRSPLRLTHKMLSKTLTHHQVMAGFIDFIFVFGTQAESRGQRFCGFKTRSQLTTLPALAADDLGRSGRFYQICYNLRSAGQAPAGGRLIWTIRQTVFHHQFDVVRGTALWISAKGDPEMHRLVKSAMQTVDKDKFKDIGRCFGLTLDIHAKHCHWCTKGWLKYIESMEKDVENFDARVAAVMQGPEENKLTVRELVEVQKLENDSNDVLTTLEANINILISLQDFYQDLVDSKMDFPAASSRGEVESFVKKLKDFRADIERNQTRASRLVRLTADKRSLVIKQLEFQSTREMEDLTISTYALGEFAQREAVAVRIITVVSLIYLPCSVVSSIFSTDIVKFQSSEPSPAGTSFSSLALQRWLEVTFPLTFLTLVLGYCGYRYEKGRQRNEIEEQRRLQLVKLGRGGTL